MIDTDAIRRARSRAPRRTAEKAVLFVLSDGVHTGLSKCQECALRASVLNSQFLYAIKFSCTDYRINYESGSRDWFWLPFIMS